MLGLVSKKFLQVLKFYKTIFVRKHDKTLISLNINLQNIFIYVYKSNV